MAYNLAGMENAASKMTGVMALINSHIQLLEGLRQYKQECLTVIEEAKRLLKVKQEEIVTKQKDLQNEILQIQQILGLDAAPKRSNMQTLMQEDIKRQKREEETEQNFLLDSFGN
jgi:phage terminase small subunit